MTGSNSPSQTAAHGFRMAATLQCPDCRVGRVGWWVGGQWRVMVGGEITPNTSSLPRELTPGNMYSAERRLQSQSETYSPLTESQKVQSSATSSQLLETREPTPGVQEPMPPLSAIPMTDQKPESDSHQDPGRPFRDSAEPPLESSQVEEETKSPL